VTSTTHFVIAPEYQHLQEEILATLEGFDTFGHILQKERNTIRRGQLANLDVTIKSFRKPGAVQGFIYGMFRPSKAKRSFEYAQTLTQKDIGTAKPVAYLERYNGKRLAESFFISLFIEHDFTIREVLKNQVEDKPKIMRQFVAFTLSLHNKSVEHLDHSPGNTLIKKIGDDYHFSIIDINRMQFRQLDLRARLNNFIRLAADAEDLKTLAITYSEMSNEDSRFCLSYMQALSAKRAKKVRFKKRLKRALKR